MFYLAILLAIVTGVAALLLRRDTPRSRHWETQEGLIDERFAFVFLPGFSIALFGLSFLAAGHLSADIHVLSVVLLAIGAIVTLVGAIASLIGLFGARYPEFLIPHWRRTSPHRVAPAPRRRRRLGRKPKK